MQPADKPGSWVYPFLLSTALFGFPIVSVLPVALHAPPRPFSIAYRVSMVLVSVGFLWRSLHLKRPTIERLVRWCLGALAVMLMLRLFWDSTIVSLPIDVPWGVYCLQVIGTTLIPALPFLLVPEDTWLVRAHRMSMWMGMLCAVAIGLGVVFSIHALVSDSGRLQTDVLNPGSIGVAGVSIYIVASTFKVKRGVALRVVKGLSLLMGPALCVVSGSKASVLSLLLLILLQFFVPRDDVRVAARVLQALVIAAVTAVGLVLAMATSDNTGFHLLSRFATARTDESTAVRLLDWNGAVAQFDQSPLLGNAAFESLSRSYPHNNILDIMMTTGMVGLLPFLVLLIVGLISAFKQLRVPETRWLSLLFIQVLLIEQTSGSVYFSSLFWIMLLAIIAAASRSQSHKVSAGSSVALT
jgi:hypothetical protein